MTAVYEPAGSLLARIKRRMTVYQAQNRVSVTPGRPIISFSFDDCPVSGIKNGVQALEHEDWLSTIYLACGLIGTENHHGLMMSDDDIKALNDNGHEIGEHTFSHLDATSVSLDRLQEDIDRNQDYLAKLGVPPSQTFAYPYGQAYPRLKKAMEARFQGSRGIQSTAHRNIVDLNQIGSFPLFSNTMDEAVTAIEKLGQTGGWLTLFTHDVRHNPSDWGCTPDDIKRVVTAVNNSGAEVMTIKDAITALGDATGRAT